ncbi:MAG: ATP-binding protein [Endozoicomonas sp. (ex Botrylloides leachii)]|nr:ATP-binding protein [Endozoicomonas sp. (ex Botrylloides leachii)]
MSSIFLRIYGGMLFSLLLVSLLSGIAITIFNSSRLVDYREAMVRGTFRIVSEMVAELPPQQRQKMLDQWSHRLTLPFSLVSQQTLALTQSEKKALRQGHVKLKALDERRAVVYSWVNSKLLLRGYIGAVSGQTSNGTISLLREYLNHLPPQRRAAEVMKLNKEAFSYPVNLISPENANLQPVQKEQLSMGGVVTVLDNEAESISLYAQLKNGHQLIQLGPLDLFKPYPFNLIIAISLFVLSSLSLAIYVLVRSMEKRLRKLERAATRFSSGDFAVRVDVKGRDSIGSLGTAFNAMASYIQHLISIQKEMIRGVSHELRTPVARLRFALEMIADAETDKARKIQLTGMDKDIEELDTLVDEFLTYANLEQGAPVIRLERHNIESIITRVVEDHLRLQSRVAIEHTPTNASEQRQFANIDQRYIHRAIQNLVGNACRYADTKIQIKFSATQDSCRISIDDDGPGIPEGQWERVFTAFARLDDSRTRKSGGYGLGLSIVQRIMYWHNGTAEVLHSPLGGARFRLTWPRKQITRNH